MRILAYRTEVNTGKVLLSESTGEREHSNELDVLFSFLLEPYEKSIRVAWELDTTVAPLLKLLGERNCIRLHETHKCYFAPFTIFYVPSKVFSVKHIPTHDMAILYDLQQYYSELEEPENLTEVQMLGEKLMQELKKMGLEPTKLTSPVAIYEQCVMQNLDLPKVADMPKEAAEFAYRCAGKLWIEAFQIGYIQEVHDYDLTSAFPKVARDLIDIRQCDWLESNEYQPSAVYGYCHCEVTIYDWVMISPILHREEDGNLTSPVGKFEEYLTKGELDFIDKWRIGEYKIVSGHWAIPKAKPLDKPLYDPLTKLLTYKERTGLQSALAKRMSTGVYGKMGEERQEEFGPYFNPCWFAEISTQTRLKVAEELYRHGIGPGNNKGYKHLLHVSVDGFLLDCPIEEVKK